MKIGIIGLPQTGKKTLFELLIEEKSTGSISSLDKQVKIGVAKIRDSRFDKLVEIYHPQKKVPATIDVVLLPKFDKETVTSGEFLKSLEQCDALCQIVRAFKDEAIFHVEGSVDPIRDIDNVFAELILSDLILTEKRIERINLDQKKGASNPNQGREKEIMLNMKKLLDENLPLISFQMSDDEKKMMSTYQFLTRKPTVIVLNVNDDQLASHSLLDKINEKYQQFSVKAMQISAKIESELSSLAPQDQEAFLKDLNIKESALNQLSQLCFASLGLITFFTVGEDEVRAWTIKKGMSAPQAAGAIHSDLERGFIRAEIMKCSDLFDFGSETALKEKGRFMLKGKDYVVEDGDIMHVRFST